MKKILIFIVIGALVFGGFGAVAIDLDQEIKANYIETEILGSSERDYTHTVFIEVGTGQFCGPCHGWNSALYSVFASGEYDFVYVEMIVWGSGGWNDILNSKANTWKNLYGINAIPTSIMDGNYRQIVGNLPSELSSKLNDCGNRAVDDLDATLTVEWEGGAKLNIDIEIKNNEGSTYNGYIRVPIAEIESRYTTAGGSKYHFGFLDYAFPMNQAISIPAGGTYTDSVVWDGAEHKDNHGDYFDDIEPDNIKVFLGVFGNDDDFIDETVAADVIINQPPEPPVITGPTNLEPGIEYEYSIVSSDPDGDELKYYVNWGDGTNSGWLGPYPSGESINLINSWDENGFYEIRAKAMDSFYQVSELSEPLPVAVGNLPPNKPEIIGPKNGGINEEQEFVFVANDPNNDKLLYYIIWGDGDTLEWIGPYDSGQEVILKHTWKKVDSFSIKAKVKDPEGLETSFTYHTIKIPRTKTSPNLYLTQLYERFLLIIQMLKNILG